MVSRKMAKSKNIQATRRWVVSSRKEKEVMLSMRPPPPGTGVPLESLLSWSRDPEVRAGRDWDCTTQNLDALGETTRQRFQGHLWASDVTLRWKTECTSITSSGETTTLWFIVSKKTHEPCISHIPPRLPGAGETRRPFRQEPSSQERDSGERLSLPLTYWLRVLGQALHSESQQMRVRSHR